jgi:hypothetical protein
MLKKYLLGAALSLAALTVAEAATVTNLGNNPTSSTGQFASLPGGTGGTGSGPFSDQVFFNLVGGPAFLTIASATNVYPQTTDFITNFIGSVWFTNNTATLADDTQIIGPILATACPLTPNCQGFAGSTILTLVGTYYLQLAGTGGGTSGFGGNLAVAQIPIPGALALFATGLAGIALLRRRRRV